MLPVLLLVAAGLWFWSSRSSATGRSDVDVGAIQQWLARCRPDLRVIVMLGSGQPGTTGFDWTAIKAQGWQAVLIVNPGLWMLAVQGGDQNTSWVEWRASRLAYLAGKCA